jgi:diguanylate cyclase (GGDEF)-like protein/PAS domain S-box-containing protein
MSKPDSETTASAESASYSASAAKRIIVIYAAFASLWILVSDNVVSFLVQDPSIITRVNIAKGWLFVAVTALLLYALIRSMQRQAHKLSERELQAQKEQANTELRMRALIQAIPDLVWLKDIDGVYLSCNSRFEQFFGAQEEMIVGKTDYDFVDRELADFFRKNDRLAMDMGGPSSNEEWVTFASDGHRELLETTKTPVHDAKGKIIGVLGIGHDMTERNAAANKIEHLAFYDSLTDLPNRRLMLDRLSRILASSARSGHPGALLLIDLDNFKQLNDTMGHAIGDQLLVSVAQRLRHSTRAADTVARMGGDEFVVILEGLAGDALAAIEAEQVAAKILTHLAEPHSLSLTDLSGVPVQRSHQCTSSIGIALFNEHSGSADELMKRADTAMYQAKAAGRNTLRFFDQAMQNVVSQRAALEIDLRNALAAQQFVLHYQAQVDATGHITGAEALVRWQHPVRGLVPPGEFIPLAEETGLVIPLGQWVLETACQQLAAWSKIPALAHLSLAVNVSARQLGLSDIVERVLAVMRASGAPANRLKLELTESLLLDNADEVIHKMAALKAQGIGFSLDDFGTGYSSLAYLKRLPLDQLKIDQSFVRDVLSDANDAVIARTVVALGKSLGLHVIAEGVETAAQRDFLLRNGCLAFQGYLFSRPVPLAQFEALNAV